MGLAGQLEVPIGQAFPLAYMPFIWVSSLFANPVLSCRGGFGALAPECLEVVLVWCGWGKGSLGAPVLWASGCLSLMLWCKVHPSGSILECC